RDVVEDKASRELDRLAASVEDQRLFARGVRDILVSLDMADETDLDAEDEADDDSEDKSDQQQDENEGEGERQSQDEGGESESAAEAMQELEEGMSEAAEAPSGEMPDDADVSEADDAGESRRPPASLSNEPRGPEYKAFSTRFDETISAEELCDAEELARLRGYLDKQLANLQGVVARLANRLQR